MEKNLQAHKFATIVGSDESINDKRSLNTVSRKSSKQKLKTIDYSDISKDMIEQQRAAMMSGPGGKKGVSLRASRFTY